MHKIRTLLKPSAISSSMRDEEQFELISFDQLKCLCKSSDLELRKALSAVGALEYQGFVRLVGVDLVEDIVTSTVNLAMANGWAQMTEDAKSRYLIDIDRLIDSDPSMAEYDREILEFCIRNLFVHIFPFNFYPNF